MTKEKAIWRCQNCGYSSAGYLGKCPSCGEWNTIVEELIKSEGWQLPSHDVEPVSISSLNIPELTRITSGFAELDLVLGGGIVPGSAILIGGRPGIGKSTLMLQVAENLAHLGKKVLYIAGEESLSQIKIRAERLKVKEELIYILNETDVRSIIAQLHDFAPQILIIDSIQSCYHPQLSSSPGTVAQVRECASQFVINCKKADIALFIVGHVTKEGSLAGPMVLEHLVDVVLYFEGESYLTHRMIRSFKNRFGSTNEVGIFEMTREGLKDIKTPSAHFLSQKKQGPGSVVFSALEGTRSFLVEIQALSGTSFQGFPARRSTGLDPNRVSILIAVLERRAGLNLYNHDIFLNVVGGIRITEPAADLAIAVAIASAFRNRYLENDPVIFGEIGLSGELRPVMYADKRIREAEKMGFKECILPAGNLDKKIKSLFSLKIVEFSRIRDVIKYLLG